jgi:hypothetical protein
VRVAIMQPYFLPYIGYWQLIGAVDRFVIYDNIKYTKKGWINRNRFLLNGADAMFSLPLQKGADTLEIVERVIADSFEPEKLLAQWRGSYQRAPWFESTIPLLREIACCPDRNLFSYLHHSIKSVCRAVDISTEILVSSELKIDHTLKGQEKVIALCLEAGADAYINAIGGMDLYSKDEFRRNGVELHFLRSRPYEYAQLGQAFIPWLSILDILMFNPLDEVKQCIRTNFELV